MSFSNIFKLSDKRDIRLDSIKGLLILLVVIGHQIEPFIGGSSELYLVYLCIYSFHMPLFVMISGYLMNPSMNRHKLIISELLLFEALVVFQFLRCLLPILHGEFNWSMLTTPGWTLWYMLSLIFWRLFLYLAYRVWNSYKVLLPTLVISILLALAIGFIPLSTEFSFQRTFYFFPFFVVGALLNEYGKHYPKFRPTRNIIVGGGIIFILCVLYILHTLKLQHNPGCLYGCKFYENGYNLFTRISGMVVGMAISLLVFRFFPTNRILALIGVETLTIYLFHTFIVKQISNKVIASGLIPGNILSMTVSAVLVTFILFLLAKTPISSWLINPFTRLNTYIKSRHN